MSVDDTKRLKLLKELYHPIQLRYGTTCFAIQEKEVESISGQSLSQLLETLERESHRPEQWQICDWLFGITTWLLLEHVRINKKGTDSHAGNQVKQETDTPDMVALKEDWSQEWKREILLRCYQHARPFFTPSAMDCIDLIVSNPEIPLKTISENLKISLNRIHVTRHRFFDRVKGLKPQIETGYHFPDLGFSAPENTLNKPFYIEAVPPVCPFEHQIIKYVIGRLSKRRVDVLENHLIQCRSCQKKLNSIRKEHGINNPLHDAIRRIAPLPRPEVPGFEIIQEFPIQETLTEYIARDTKSGQHVLIRLLYGRTSPTEDHTIRFQHEIDIMSNLNHPNILPIQGAGTSPDGPLFYITKNVRLTGFSFQQEEQNMELRQALRRYITLCEIVCVIHEQGIVHGCLHHNRALQMDHNENPYLDSFEYARQIGEPVDPEVVSSIWGKMKQCLPLELNQPSCKADPRSDVFQLGVILFGLLTRQFPFDNTRDNSDAFDNMITDSPDSLRQKWNYRQPLCIESAESRKDGSCPFDPDLEAIVRKAISRGPVNRHDNAGDFAAEIRNYLDTSEEESNKS